MVGQLAQRVEALHVPAMFGTGQVRQRVRDDSGNDERNDDEGDQDVHLLHGDRISVGGGLTLPIGLPGKPVI
jgi:hypothetical protein